MSVTQCLKQANIALDSIPKLAKALGDEDITVEIMASADFNETMLSPYLKPVGLDKLGKRLGIIKAAKALHASGGGGRDGPAEPETYEQNFVRTLDDQWNESGLAGASGIGGGPAKGCAAKAKPGAKAAAKKISTPVAPTVRPATSGSMLLDGSENAKTLTRLIEKNRSVAFQMAEEINGSCGSLSSVVTVTLFGIAVAMWVNQLMLELY